jgi:hypothetical protein
VAKNALKIHYLYRLQNESCTSQYAMKELNIPIDAERSSFYEEVASDFLPDTYLRSYAGSKCPNCPIFCGKNGKKMPHLIPRQNFAEP